MALKNNTDFLLQVFEIIKGREEGFEVINQTTKIFRILFLTFGDKTWGTYLQGLGQSQNTDWFLHAKNKWLPVKIPMILNGRKRSRNPEAKKNPEVKPTVTNGFRAVERGQKEPTA